VDRIIQVTRLLVSNAWQSARSDLARIGHHGGLSLKIYTTDKPILGNIEQFDKTCCGAEEQRSLHPIDLSAPSGVT